MKHEITNMSAVVNYVREMTTRKSSKCGKYGLCVHLLFMFKFCGRYMNYFTFNHFEVGFCFCFRWWDIIM